MLEKTCSLCKKRKPIEAFGSWKYSKDGLNHRCRECHNRKNRESWAAIGAAQRRYMYHTDPERREKMQKAAAAVVEKNPNYYRESKKRRYRELRNSVLDIIGFTCACCGEGTYEFLAIDHIHGGGTQHRKTVGHHEALYREILTMENPKLEFQTLCHNCNAAKGFYGSCPHIRNLEEEDNHAA